MKIIMLFMLLGLVQMEDHPGDDLEPKPRKRTRGGPGTGTGADWSFCSSTNLCGVGQGDCDGDSQCKEGMKCGVDNCKSFNPAAHRLADCCTPPPPKRGCRNPRGKSGDIAVCQGGTWNNKNSKLPAIVGGTTPCSNPTGINGMTATCIRRKWRPNIKAKCYGSYNKATLSNNDESLWLSDGGAVNVTLWAGPYAGKKEIIVGIQLGYGNVYGSLYGSKTKNEMVFSFTKGNFATGVRGCKAVEGDDGFIYKLGFYVNNVQEQLFPNNGQNCSPDDLNARNYQLAYISAKYSPQTSNDQSVVGQICFFFYTTSG